MEPLDSLCSADLSGRTHDHRRYIRGGSDEDETPLRRRGGCVVVTTAMRDQPRCTWRLASVCGVFAGKHHHVRETALWLSVCHAIMSTLGMMIRSLYHLMLGSDVKFSRRGRTDRNWRPDPLDAHFLINGYAARDEG